jgi:hypothetical protein
VAQVVQGVGGVNGQAPPREPDEVLPSEAQYKAAHAALAARDPRTWTDAERLEMERVGEPGLESIHSRICHSDALPSLNRPPTACPQCGCTTMHVSWGYGNCPLCHWKGKV